jgi:hypothetical protein
MIKLLIIITFLVGCSSVKNKNTQAIISQDTISRTQSIGYDYVELVNKSLNHNKHSLSKLFWLTTHAGYDGIASDSHSGILGEILRRTGDDYFGKTLALESNETQKEVIEMLFYDFGFGNSKSITAEQLKEWYPLTFKYHN